jgi:hypothetical protein
MIPTAVAGLTESAGHRYYSTDGLVLNDTSSMCDPLSLFYLKGRTGMKLVTAVVATASAVLFGLSMASANPALLPKHEGYPMKNSGSPVTGQPTANDPGQSDAHGTSSLLKSADSVKSAEQTLTKTDNARITEGQGAGRLPHVEGPKIMIAPPVTSATKITGDRKID